MSSELVPFQRPGLLAPRLSRQLHNELIVTKGQAIARAARVRGVQFVTEEALLAVGSLSELEGRLIQMTPLAEPRLRAIVDLATAAITEEISNIGGGYR